MAKRVDNNQPEIVRQLREIGATVDPCYSQIGSGRPDIIVGYHGINFLFEIKDPAQPPSKRRLTPEEGIWHAEWTGQVAVIETVDDALKIMNRAVKGL
jgi:hypothetical protein